MFCVAFIQSFSDSIQPVNQSVIPFSQSFNRSVAQSGDPNSGEQASDQALVIVLCLYVSLIAFAKLHLLCPHAGFVFYCGVGRAAQPLAHNKTLRSFFVCKR